MAATTVFRLPDLGEGLTEAEIVTWHVSVGDRVVAGQPLVSVETDKAVVEIPAPQSGLIVAIAGAVGDRLPVGAPLVTFGEAGPASGVLVGRLEEAESPAAPPDQPGAVPQPPEPPRGPAAEAGPAPAGQRIAASPAVRRLARELGVDLTRLTGSGPDGVIRSSDVETAAARTSTGPAAAAGARVTRVHGARRAMAERMADAHARVVPASVTGEADIHAWTADSRPLLRLIRAIGAAARAEPRLNAAFDDARWELRQPATIDLGIAMETDDGLFVPVLRDIGGRPVAELAAEAAALERAVRARKLPPERLRGQTITLSNFGAVAGWHAAMVVVPPQVAIIGAGRAAPRVVADGDRAVVHRVLPLSITVDHRVITGVEACRFLAALIADLELGQ